MNFTYLPNLPPMEKWINEVPTRMKLFENCNDKIAAGPASYPGKPMCRDRMRRKWPRLGKGYLILDDTADKKKQHLLDATKMDSSRRRYANPKAKYIIVFIIGNAYLDRTGPTHNRHTSASFYTLATTCFCDSSNSGYKTISCQNAQQLIIHTPVVKSTQS